MAGLALSTIGVIFGYGLGTTTTAPTTFKQIEECVSIDGVEFTKEKLDATPLESKKKKYVGGHEDTGGELPVTFNASDTFEEQWAEMLETYDGKESNQAIQFKKDCHTYAEKIVGNFKDRPFQVKNSYMFLDGVDFCFYNYKNEVNFAISGCIRGNDKLEIIKAIDKALTLCALCEQKLNS